MQHFALSHYQNIKNSLFFVNQRTFLFFSEMEKEFRKYFKSLDSNVKFSQFIIKVYSKIPCKKFPQLKEKDYKKVCNV